MDHEIFGRGCPWGIHPIWTDSPSVTTTLVEGSILIVGESGNKTMYSDKLFYFKLNILSNS